MALGRKLKARGGANGRRRGSVAPPVAAWTSAGCTMASAGRPAEAWEGAYRVRRRARILRLMAWPD